MSSKGSNKNTVEKKTKATTEVQSVVEKSSSKNTSKSQKASSKPASKTKEPVVVKADVIEKPVVEAVVEKSKTGKAKASKKQPKAQEVVAPVVVQDQEDGADEEHAKNGLRYFKLDYQNEVGGRYSGKKPKQAANKAYSSIIRKKGLVGGGQKIQFAIRECTRGSKQKTYTYDGERIELDEPVEVIIKSADGNKPIKYKFSNKLSKAKQAAAAVSE